MAENSVKKVPIFLYYVGGKPPSKKGNSDNDQAAQTMFDQYEQQLGGNLSESAKAKLNAAKEKMNNLETNNKVAEQSRMNRERGLKNLPFMTLEEFDQYWLNETLSYFEKKNDALNDLNNKRSAETPPLPPIEMDSPDFKEYWATVQGEMFAQQQDDMLQADRENALAAFEEDQLTINKTNRDNDLRSKAVGTNAYSLIMYFINKKLNLPEGVLYTKLQSEEMKSILGQKWRRYFIKELEYDEVLESEYMFGATGKDYYWSLEGTTTGNTVQSINHGLLLSTSKLRADWIEKIAKKLAANRVSRFIYDDLSEEDKKVFTATGSKPGNCDSEGGGDAVKYEMFGAEDYYIYKMWTSEEDRNDIEILASELYNTKIYMYNSQKKSLLEQIKDVINHYFPDEKESSIDAEKKAILTEFVSLGKTLLTMFMDYVGQFFQMVIPSVAGTGQTNPYMDKVRSQIDIVGNITSEMESQTATMQDNMIVKTVDYICQGIVAIKNGIFWLGKWATTMTFPTGIFPPWLAIPPIPQLIVNLIIKVLKLAVNSIINTIKSTLFVIFDGLSGGINTVVSQVTADVFNMTAAPINSGIGGATDSLSGVSTEFEMNGLSGIGL